MGQFHLLHLVKRPHDDRIQKLLLEEKHQKLDKVHILRIFVVLHLLVLLPVHLTLSHHVHHRPP